MYLQFDDKTKERLSRITVVEDYLYGDLIKCEKIEDIILDLIDEIIALDEEKDYLCEELEKYKKYI